MNVSDNFTKAPNEIVRSCKLLTLQERAVWLILQSYDYGDGHIFISDKTLAREAGVTDRYVRDIRMSLKEKGYRDWQRRDGTTSLYTMRSPFRNKCEAQASDTAVVSHSEGGTTLDSHGTIVPDERNNSSGVDRANGSGEGRNVSSDKEYSLEENSSKENLHKNRGTPLTPQGGNGGGHSISSKDQQLEETAQYLLAYFVASYKDRFDLDYVLRKGTKDLKEFKDMLAHVHPKDIQSCIDEFMDDDDYTLDRKKTVAMFRARINSYMQPDEYEEY